MPILLDIVREHTRVTDMGLRPIILQVDATAHKRLKEEASRLSLFRTDSDRESLMGMEIRHNMFIGDGVFRVLTDDKTWKELS